jgi:nicastrin
LKFVVELSEFGNLASDDSTLWIHKDPITYNSSESIKNQVDLLINSLKSYSNNTIKQVSSNEQPLPPSSIHSFLRQNVTIPSILIADHEIEYKNQFFRSIYDKRENLNLEWPSNITEEDAVNSVLKFSNNIQIQTTIISKFLYEILTDNKTQLTNEVDIRLVNNLIYCYMFNSTCQFFQSIQSSDINSQYLSQLKSVSPKNVLSFYTAVTNQVTSGILITNSVLKYVTRERLADNLNSSECELNSDSVKELIKSQQRRYTEAFFMKNGNFYDNRTICILSISFSNTSISPAFTDYLANQTTTDKLQNFDFYPSWTESVWRESNTMKIFLFSTKTIESVTLAIGICVAIISFIFTFLANKYLSRWLLEGEEIESLNDNY